MFLKRNVHIGMQVSVNKTNDINLQNFFALENFNPINQLTELVELYNVA